MRTAQAVLGLALAACVQPSAAGNGINLIGFGVESWFMAGADTAMSRDTGALSTNPAGLTQIRASAFDTHGGVASNAGSRHRDQFGNNRGVDNKTLVIGDFGFARRLPDSRFAWGVGLFGQGGAGNVYKSLNTAFGTQDELSALFRVARFSPGVAYQATDKLALGVSVPLLYADFKEKFFANTSVAPSPAAPPFFGIELKDARALRAGVKVGAMYKPNDRLTLALTLSNRVDLTLKDGTLKVNYDALGLGRVTYRDAQAAGLHLPQEIALGAAQRVGERWMLSLKLSRLNWSRAFRTLRLSGSRPDNPLAPPTVSNTASLDWRDQTVIALGAAYEASEKTTILGGVNYGRSPAPPRTLTPLLAATTQMHATLGVIRKLNAHWQASAGLEYDFARRVTYTNPEVPFGANAQERGEIIAVHFGVGRRW